MSGRRLVGTIALLACFTVSVGAVQPAGPKIKLSAPAWDFGTVRHLEKPEFVLVVSNEGSAELRLTNVRSSCGCTIAQPTKYALAPGESTTVKVVFDTKGKQDAVSSQVTIASNDPAAPEVVFKVSGNVRRLVRVDPIHGILFRVVEPTEVSTQTVKLVNQQAQPMRPTIRELPSDRFAVELREIRQGQEYDLVVTTRPPLSRGAPADTVDILTGLDEEPVIPIAMAVNMVDRVNFSPPVMFMKSPVVPGFKSQMRIEYYGSDPNFKVTGATCDDPAVKLKLDAPQEPPVVRPGVLRAKSVIPLSVEIPAGGQIPAQGYVVKVVTNDPEYPQLQFTITSDNDVFHELLRRAQATSQRRVSP